MTISLATTILFVVYPEARAVVSIPLTTGPIFFFELSIAVWLLVKGLPASLSPRRPKTG